MTPVRHRNAGAVGTLTAPSAAASGGGRMASSAAALPALAVGFAALTAVALAACGGGTPPPEVSSPTEGYGAVSSDAAVTRFLDAAQAGNYAGMWAVFGTQEGPAIERYGVKEIEPRMAILSRLLKHDDYELELADLAGLGPNRARYEVRMTGTRKGNVTVPFITAHDARGRWYVEQFEANRLSGGSGLN